MRRFLKFISLIFVLTILSTNVVLGATSSPSELWKKVSSTLITPASNRNIQVNDITIDGTCTGCGVSSGAFDLNGEALTLDADADSTLTADTDDQLDLALGGADALSITLGSSITSLFAPTNTLIRFGSSGTSGHSLTTNDFLFTADIEVDGLAYLDAGAFIPSDIFLNFGDSNEVKIGYDKTDTDAYSMRVGLPNDLSGNNTGAIWFGAQSDVIDTDIGIDTGDSYVLGVFQKNRVSAVGIAPIDAVATIVGVGTKAFQMFNPASGVVFSIASDSTTTTFTAESETDLLLSSVRLALSGGLIPGTVDINNTDSPYTIPTAIEFIRANTTSGVITATLPAIGATNDKQVYTIIDSNYNAGVNNITIAPTGSDKIDNVAASYVISTNGMTRSVQANNATKNWQIY